jgi:hypothetical protein
VLEPSISTLSIGCTFALFHTEIDQIVALRKNDMVSKFCPAAAMINPVLIDLEERGHDNDLKGGREALMSVRLSESRGPLLHSSWEIE